MSVVFIVDDDEVHLELMHRRLSREGFTVHSTTSSLGVTNKVRALHPTLVLLDVQIPAIRGDRLMELIRTKADQSTRFFYHSSIDEDELHRLAKRDGMHGCFSKSEPLARVVRRLRIEARMERTPASEARALD